MSVGTFRAKMWTIGRVSRQVSCRRAFWKKKEARVGLAHFRRQTGWCRWNKVGRPAWRQGWWPKIRACRVSQTW